MMEDYFEADIGKCKSTTKSIEPLNPLVVFLLLWMLMLFTTVSDEETNEFFSKLAVLRTQRDIFLKMINDMRRRLKELPQTSPATQQYRLLLGCCVFNLQLKSPTCILSGVHDKPSFSLRIFDTIHVFLKQWIVCSY